MSGLSPPSSSDRARRRLLLHINRSTLSIRWWLVALAFFLFHTIALGIKRYQQTINNIIRSVQLTNPSPTWPLNQSCLSDSIHFISFPCSPALLYVAFNTPSMCQQTEPEGSLTPLEPLLDIHILNIVLKRNPRVSLCPDLSICFGPK